MAYRWQLQEAKNRFSEVVDEALAHGPQLVTRHGQEVVVILSYAEYKQLQKAQLPLGEFLRQSPLAGAEDLGLERDSTAPRPDFEL
jgi:prevent-host-death family protein